MLILPLNLSRMVGATFDEVEGWLEELTQANVLSVAEDGAFFSRRMVRDEEIRAKRAAGGKLGGNPTLLKGKKKDTKVNPKDQGKVNHLDNPKPTPASASASASALEEDTPNGVSPAAKKRKRRSTKKPSLAQEAATQAKGIYAAESLEPPDFGVLVKWTQQVGADRMLSTLRRLRSRGKLGNDSYVFGAMKRAASEPTDGPGLGGDEERRAQAENLMPELDEK